MLSDAAMLGMLRMLAKGWVGGCCPLSGPILTVTFDKLALGVCGGAGDVGDVLSPNGLCPDDARNAGDAEQSAILALSWISSIPT